MPCAIVRSHYFICLVCALGGNCQFVRTSVVPGRTQTQVIFAKKTEKRDLCVNILFLLIMFPEVLSCVALYGMDCSRCRTL